MMRIATAALAGALMLPLTLPAAQADPATDAGQQKKTRRKRHNSKKKVRNTKGQEKPAGTQ